MSLLRPRFDGDAAAHAAVLGGDAAAREEIARVLFPVTNRILACRYRRVDPVTLAEAAGDAILNYLRHPGAYDPARGRLEAFIAQIAMRRTIDLLRREARWRRALAEGPATVAAQVPESLESLDGPIDLGRLLLSPPERAFLEARLDGERRIAVLAGLIGLDGETVEVQRLAVKRMRDVLQYRLRRVAARQRASS